MQSLHVTLPAVPSSLPLHIADVHIAGLILILSVLHCHLHSVEEPVLVHVAPLKTLMVNMILCIVNVIKRGVLGEVFGSQHSAIHVEVALKLHNGRRNIHHLDHDLVTKPVWGCIVGEVVVEEVLSQHGCKVHDGGVLVPMVVV